MEPNFTYWQLKSFFSWFIVSKAWTTMVISSNFFDFFSFAIKLCEGRLFIGSHFENLQLRNVLLIKKPFNHVNKNMFRRKLYLWLFCGHVPQIVLVCQLRISQVLHLNSHNFKKFLQCRLLALCRGIFHYNTTWCSKMNQYVTAI